MVLVLLAFDTWLNMMPEGAKYGVGAFNVAHFPWFDGFVPSSGFYLGVLAFTGVLALSQALYRPHRIAIVLIALGYTLGWSCSLLDSVPYHYLLSLYLLCFVFFPMLSARAAFSRSERAAAGKRGGVRALLRHDGHRLLSTWQPGPRRAASRTGCRWPAASGTCW